MAERDRSDFEAQSISGMQRAVFNGEMSVGDYYERQVGTVIVGRYITNYFYHFSESVILPDIYYIYSQIGAQTSRKKCRIEVQVGLFPNSNAPKL